MKTVRSSTRGLLSLAQHGDRRALERLFCFHLPLLTRWARRRAPPWIRRGGGADDLVQRTILNTLRRLQHLNPAQEDQLQGYLRRSLVNLVRDDYRRARRTPPPMPLNETLMARSPSPLRVAIARQEIRRYDAALARLRPAARNAIVGRFERGLGYSQLATALGRPSAEAARLVVARAMVSLRREMRRPRAR